MIIAFMEGHPKARFREQLEDYRVLLGRIDRYEKAFRKFADDECKLHRPDWTGGPGRYCHSAVHPDGWGERRFCTITNCTWHLEGAFKFEDKKKQQCPQCKGSRRVMSDYPYSETCPKCKGRGEL